MKQVLILGGTLFTGRVLTQSLLKRNDLEITLFHRGKSNPDLFKEVNKIIGNRETEDVNKIYEKKWDVVVDFSGYYPDTFYHLTETIKTNLYIFISTLSVYDTEKSTQQLVFENSQTLDCSAAQRTSKLPDAYGEKKAEMERILIQSGLKYLILRPSFIIGPFDWTDRFYYWLYKVKYSDVIEIPKPGLLDFSFVFDLASAIESAIFSPLSSKIVNAVSLTGVSLESIIDETSLLLNKKTKLIIANTESYEDFPLCHPTDMQFNNDLWKTHFPELQTPLREVIKQSLLYADSLGWPKPKVGKV